MKIAAVKDDRIIIEEAPDLKLGENSGAVIKTIGCGLCGSDIVKFRHALVKNGTVLGHEVVGEIIEINSKTNFKVGDKIVSSHHIPCFDCDYCRRGNISMCLHFKDTNIHPGGFSQKIYLSEEHLQNVAYKIPSNLSDVEASFYEPLGCCVRAIKRAEFIEDSKVLIVGLGSIGILMGQAAVAYGAKAYGCDIIQERIDVSNKLGIFSSMPDDVEEKNFDYIFMTSGADVTIELALRAVKDGGKIIVFASTPKNFGYANNEIYYRELTVLGSYSPAPSDLKDALDLLALKKVSVENLSTVYNLEDIEQAFRDTIDNAILKAYVKMN